MITPSDLVGKKVLLRADLDLPIKEGRVENLFRLEALLPTLNLCLKHASRTCLIGHLGRPSGADHLGFSLQPVINKLKESINQDITLYPSGYSPGDWWKGESPLCALDNLRFNPQEESLSGDYARDLATGADIYIYEAFATYRPCTSLNLIPEVLPTLTGLQFDTEISTLSKVLNNPHKPSLLIASGAKTDKLEIIRQISPRFDHVFLGGKFAKPEHLTIDGLDVNNLGTKELLHLISEAQTIVLNGPLGRFEDGIHELATKTVLKAIQKPQKFAILGGGDTLSAIPHLGFSYTQYGFVSTGGGAILNFFLTGSHPLLEVLKKC